MAPTRQELRAHHWISARLSLAGNLPTSHFVAGATPPFAVPHRFRTDPLPARFVLLGPTAPSLLAFRCFTIRRFTAPASSCRSFARSPPGVVERSHLLVHSSAYRRHRFAGAPSPCHACCFQQQFGPGRRRAGVGAGFTWGPGRHCPGCRRAAGLSPPGGPPPFRLIAGAWRGGRAAGATVTGPDRRAPPGVRHRAGRAPASGIGGTGHRPRAGRQPVSPPLRRPPTPGGAHIRAFAGLPVRPRFHSSSVVAVSSSGCRFRSA